MRNRFNSREVLCDGIGFNPNVGGTGGVNPLQPKGEIKEAPGAAAIRSIENIMASIGQRTQSSLMGESTIGIIRDAQASA